MNQWPRLTTSDVERILDDFGKTAFLREMQEARGTPAVEVLLTRAIQGYEYGSGRVSGTIWRCPKCQWWPDHCDIPPFGDMKCLNCGEPLGADEPGNEITAVSVEKTDYGYKLTIL